VTRADDGHKLTRLLDETARGREGAMEELIDLVYGELLDLARARMASERKAHTLQAVDLVHAAYLRLRGDLQEGSLANRAHFFHAAGEAMRRILIEHARARARLRRGGGMRRLPITGLDLAADDDPGDLLALEEAVRRLEDWEPRLGQVVRLRFYAGLDVEETAEAMGVSPRTVKRDWNFARAWLYNALRESES